MSDALKSFSPRSNDRDEGYALVEVAAGDACGLANEAVPAAGPELDTDHHHAPDKINARRISQQSCPIAVTVIDSDLMEQAVRTPACKANADERDRERRSQSRPRESKDASASETAARRFR